MNLRTKTNDSPLRKRLLVVVLALSTLFVAGCGAVADKVGEKVAEKAVEKVAESASGGEVDIDSKDGKLSIKTDEGSMEFGSAELPEGFPDLPVYDDMQIQSSMSSGNDESRMFNVIAMVPGEFNDVSDTVKADLEASSFTIEGTNEVDYGDYKQRSFSVSGSDYSGMVGVMMSDEGTLITYTLETATDAS